RHDFVRNPPGAEANGRSRLTRSRGCRETCGSAQNRFARRSSSRKPAMTTWSKDARLLPRYAWISAWAAVVTIVLKTSASALTGSIGLLSDALESFVNLATAALAIAMLNLAARPEDEDHPHGHGKAEYFSSGVEGALVFLTGIGIAAAAVQRFLHPHALEQL